MKDENAPDWLPELLDFDWNEYQQSLDRAYAVFERDFGRAHSRPDFRGKQMGLKRHPEFDGKSATFWHFVTEGDVEAERSPNRERIERIAWPKAMLLEANSENPRVLVWSSKRGRSTRWLVALADFSYVVVVDEREEFVLPWTAYVVEHGHRREKLRREYSEWQRARKS